MSDLNPFFKDVFCDITAFTEKGDGLTLRRYQREAAMCICNSVLDRQGLTFVVMFPRQSGKNELQAQIEAYLLSMCGNKDVEIVKISPTFKPQTLNAMRRLEQVLEANSMTHGKWEKESGYIYRIRQARIVFLSGSPETNIVGATASLLLEVDEAQDIEIEKFDKEIAPMAASTNATRVFWGTAWTSQTLLGRELRAARAAETLDGVRRVFVETAETVAAEVPAYGRFVAEQVARLGRDSPMVRTQYFSEEIDGTGGMFPAERAALMRGQHAALFGPPAPDYGPLFRQGAAATKAQVYCLLVDVAGEDEGSAGTLTGAGRGTELKNPGRDATALTVVEVDLETLADPLIKAPTYRAVQRRQWVGVGHSELYAQLLALAKAWCARWLVVDATGVGAGLASFLGRALPGKVVPFLFNQASKSKLGWDFLSIVDGGRWKDFDPRPGDGVGESQESQVMLQALFFRQLAFCQYELAPGPGKVMKWGVPDGRRDPATGELLHDDLVTSAALAGVLDGLKWEVGGQTLVVKASDPLKEMDKGW
jgi:hypothetical protein